MLTQELRYWEGLTVAGDFRPTRRRRWRDGRGVLVVHEGLGLNAHIMEQTLRVAGLGYVALAADMFGEPC